MSDKGLGRGEFFVIVAFLIFAVTIITYFAAFKQVSTLPQQEDRSNRTARQHQPRIKVSHLALDEESVPGYFKQSAAGKVTGKEFINQLQGVDSFQFKRYYSGWQQDFMTRSQNLSKDSYSLIKNLVAVTTKQDADRLLKKIRKATFNKGQVDPNQIEAGIMKDLGEDALLLNKSVGGQVYYQLHLTRGPFYSYVLIAGADPEVNDILLYGLKLGKRMKLGLSKLESARKLKVKYH